uniref:VCBS domain-containing protein n=1 Tax=Dongia deserti TaxID=2268030 RepID=UPI0025476D81
MTTSDLSSPTAPVGLSTVSYSLTPQAKDDYYTVTEDGFVYLIDVMANDLGGKAKTLYSIDGIEDGVGVVDLLVKDASFTAPNESTATLESITCSEQSAMGADIAIVNGKILYKTNTTQFQDAFNHLAAGQVDYDTVTYAIRLSNGTLSTGTLTIAVIGTNDDPTVTAGPQSPLKLVEAGEDEAGVASASIALTLAD